MLNEPLCATEVVESKIIVSLSYLSLLVFPAVFFVVHRSTVCYCCQITLERKKRVRVVWSD